MTLDQSYRNNVSTDNTPDVFLFYSIVAEEAVLGSILISGHLPANIDQILRAEDFYSQRNRKVYEAIVRLSRRGSVDLNQVTVAHELGDELEEVGGAGYLGILVSNTPTSLHAISYATIIVEEAAKRRIQRISASLSDYLGNGSALGIATAMSKDLMAVRAPDPALRSKFSAKELVDNMIFLAQNAPTNLLSTGFPVIDKNMHGGFTPGQLVVLGGRPGSGKTALAMQLAVRAATQHKVAVGILSLEMSGVELMSRATSAMTQLPADVLMEAVRNQSMQAVPIMDAWGALSDLNLTIDEQPSVSAENIDLWARRQHAEAGLDMLVVDHIQLVAGDERKTRVDQLDVVTRTLKSIARDLNCVVLACSQLSRDPARDNREPTITDLRDSGAIEQNADAVLILHKQVAKKDPVKAKKQEGDIPIVDIHLAKNRSGKPGKQFAIFEQRFSRFVDWTEAKNRSLTDKTESPY